MTEAGYVGEDVENILLRLIQAADFDIEKATVALPQMAKVSEFLRKMQFYTFVKNIDKILSSFNQNEEESYENLSLFSPLIPQALLLFQ